MGDHIVPAKINDDPLYDRVQAAQYLGDIRPATLATWASTHRYNLPFIRVGRKIRYRRSDLDAFIASRREGGTQEATVGS